MAFETIDLSKQESQKARVVEICDDFLICTILGFDSSGNKTNIKVAVSKPIGLRTMDYYGGGDYIRLNSQSRKGSETQVRTDPPVVSQDLIGSGTQQWITPSYESGEEIYITKKVSDSTQTSTSVTKDYWNFSCCPTGTGVAITGIVSDANTDTFTRFQHGFTNADIATFVDEFGNIGNSYYVGDATSDTFRLYRHAIRTAIHRLDVTNSSTGIRLSGHDEETCNPFEGMSWGDLQGSGCIKLADFLIDENRAGKSWTTSGGGGGGGGVPAGYKEQCINLCIEGADVDGKILFKSGC